MTESMRLLGELNLELAKDTNAAMIALGRRQSAYDSESDDFVDLLIWYRLAARIFYAHADGVLFSMRKCVQERVGDPLLEVSARDRNWMMNSPDMARFRGNLHVAMRYFPMLAGMEKGFSRDDECYRAFETLVNCRAGMSHPSTPRQLFSLEIFAALQPGVEWLLGTYREILFAQLRALDPEARDASAPPRKFIASDAKTRALAAKAEKFVASRYEGTNEDQFEQFVIDILADAVFSLRLGVETAKTCGLEMGRWAVKAGAMSVFALIEGLVRAAEGYISRTGASMKLSAKRVSSCSEEELVETLADFADEFSLEVGAKRKIQRGLPEWSAVIRARRAPDRFVHPRGLRDTLVESKDVLDLLSAGQLLSRELLPMFHLP